MSWFYVAVIVLSSPQDSQWGRRAVILDPDGYKVELVS
ncbi:MAG: VOC family protein [Cyanobacteria bacterium J06635_10]